MKRRIARFMTKVIAPFKNALYLPTDLMYQYKQYASRLIGLCCTTMSCVKLSLAFCNVIIPGDHLSIS